MHFVKIIIQLRLQQHKKSQFFIQRSIKKQNLIIKNQLKKSL